MLFRACLPLMVMLSGSLAAEPVTDRPLAVKAEVEPAKALYRSQLLDALDHPLAETITIAGQVITTKVGDKGVLEVDAAGEGRFKKLTKPSTVTIEVPLPAPEGKRAKTMKLGVFFNRTADDVWTWRIASQLSIALGKEQLAVVDVNGNGSFNDVGIDGMCWAGQEWLFPLPAADERFCTDTLDVTGLTISPLGDVVELQGRPLVTTLEETLPVLQGINRSRVLLGLTPRPENTKLSADLQQHCAYMATNGQLTHPEDKGKPGYSDAGNAAGMRSILSVGTAPDRIAAMMVETYFHRQDVIRPETRGFGVGYQGRYGGIDGRSEVADVGRYRWPILCPVPDQRDIPLRYQKESPDATPGDDQAGYPITVYFGRGKPKLISHRLSAVGTKGELTELPCYLFDPTTGASAEFSGFQHCVCVMAKDPLQSATLYEVEIQAEGGDGKPWQRTWRFSTVGK